MKKVVHLFFIVVGVLLGYQLCPDLFLDVFHLHRSFVTTNWFGAAVGGALFLVATVSLAGYVSALLRWLEERLKSAPLADILGGTAGMVIGLVVAYLFSPEIRAIPLVGVAVEFFVAVFFAYLGLRIGFTKREELWNLFAGRLSLRDREKSDGKEKEKKPALRPGDAKLLDTSVIIDGRIADLVETGFLDGTLVIPSFVLAELQHIADSSDALKRNRGRRGLDILNRIQKESKVQVQIVETDFDDIQEVDAKLVRLAKQMRGKVMTNDFNLNKICELQGVPVLNINDLANALKPVVLPGEELHVHVIKDGKEHNQGVAYLDDGTMIVIEGGREYIGGRITVLVTSVLQTSAGRMIFAKPKLLEKAL